MPDLVLRGGTVVDGTGAPRRRADVAVSGGRVVEVGRIGGAGREVDVTGLVVAPGFVDLHTHYDAQIHWDPTMSPSGLHGVTTIIGGNCGFTVAPMREEHAEYLIKMLAKVEGMPLAALESGIAFEWGSFGEWLDHLEARGMALNAGFLVGHSTIRRLVMGEGTSNPATEAQVTAMAALLAESLAAGGLGFSSSWSSTHLDGENNPVPSRFADASELVALARVAGSHEGTTLEFIPGLIPFGPKEAGVMIDMSLAANRTINWNLVRVNTPDTTIAESALAHSDDAAKRGAAIVGLINPEPNQSQFNLAVGKLFELLPGWRETMVLPLPERMAAFRDPTVRERLFDCTRSVTAEPMVQLCRWGELIISQTFSEENRPFEGRTVGEVASELGTTPFDTLVDLALRDDLRTNYRFSKRGVDEATWQKRRDFIRDDRTMVGGSDAGAHLEVLCGARYTTSILAEAVREHAVLSLEEAVYYLTDAPARFYGLRDRGRVQPGFWADLVAFDPERIGPGELYSRNDLPAGAARLYADAEGIEHVFVNGTEIVNGGAYTGSLPGHLLRSTNDIETVNPRSYRAQRKIFSDSIGV